MERIANTAEYKIGWHKHYETILENDFAAKIDHKLLTKYEEDKKGLIMLKKELLKIFKTLK